MFKTLKSVVVGIAAGAALGVLFSPDKGKALRKGIKEEIKKGGTGLNTIKKTVLEMGKDLGETAKETYEEVQASEAYKTGSKKAKVYVAKAAVEAKKAYKKNVPAKTRKKIGKTVSKAKKTATKAKSAATEVAKKLKK